MDSLTKLAKCEGGLIAENLSPQENAVKELLRQVIEAHYAQADAKHMDIRCTVPEELLEKIQSQSSVKEAYLLAENSWALSVQDTSSDTVSHVRVCSVNSGKILPHLFIRITEGHFPETTTEIALNTLDFPNVSIGDTVTAVHGGFALQNPDGSFALTEDGNIATETKQKTYTVTALYTSEADRRSQIAGVVLYDSADISFGNSCSVILSYTNTLNLFGKHNDLVAFLEGYTTPTGEVHANINNAYLSASEPAVSFTDVLLVLLAVAVIFFCAFFLIYNIYAISLAQDM